MYTYIYDELNTLALISSSFRCVTWRIYTCDMTQIRPLRSTGPTQERRESFINVTWCIHTCDMMNWYVRDDCDKPLRSAASTKDTSPHVCLIRMYDMTYSYAYAYVTHSYVWHDSCSHMCDTTHAYVSRSLALWTRRFHQAFHKIDTDDSKTISLDEFLQYYLSQGGALTGIQLLHPQPQDYKHASADPRATNSEHRTFNSASPAYSVTSSSVNTSNNAK